MKTYEDARTELRSRLEDYLTAKGINTRTNFSCLTGKHEDTNPSMSFDKNRNKVHCFSCNEDLDIVDLIKIDYNITDTAEAFKKGYELYNIEVGQSKPKSEQYTHNTDNAHNTDKTDKAPKYATNPNTTKEDLRAYFDKCHTQIKGTSYLKDRGLSDAIIDRFNVGYDKECKKAGVNWKAVIIPTGANSYVIRNTDTNSADRYRKQGEAQLFNIDAFKTTNPIFIVEGEIDALSVMDSGKEAIGLGSLSNNKKLLDYVNKNHPNNTLILALDKDENNRGQEAQEDLYNQLLEAGAKVIKADITGAYKDANEALQKDKSELINRLECAYKEAQDYETAEQRAEREEYKKNYASSHITDFLNGIKEKANTPYIPTGFKALDNVLDGGLFEGLYFIGAISSLGKTTFTLQIADQIAQAGQDVIIFSLEMARNELIAKSISRQTLLKSNSMKDAKTTRGITTYSRYLKYSDTERTLINEAIKSYSDYADRIIIHEGQGEIGTREIKKAVEDHIRITGNKPVVVIDYLQIIAPYNDRATDKQNTDKAVTELKRLSRDNKISVIAISSLNRDNYNSKISMQAFKESGAIEYSSDVLIGLQFKGQGENKFDIDTAKQKSNDVNSPREIELKILKNRNGRTGDSIYYNYYPLFNYFKEV